MAVKQVVIDDMSGEEGASTRSFSIDGTAYEVDLTDSNAAKLLKSLDPYIKVARKKGSAPKKYPKSKVTTPTASADLNAIRDWAKANGRKVSDRGRIPKDVVDAFNETHSVVPAFSG